MARKTAPLARESSAPENNQIDPIGKGDDPANQRDTTDYPARTELSESQPTTYGRKPCNGEKRWIERGKLALEALTLAAVVFYGIVAYRQWRAMLKSNKLTRQSADAAKESADAAVAASRAWIMPSAGNLGKARWANSFLVVELDWTNAGKSPALRIRGTAEYRVDLMGGPFNAGCATLKKTVWETSESLLLAGDEFRLTLQSLPRNWNEKAKILSIHGCIRYTDVLTNQQRTTEFCEEVTNIRGIVLVGECTRPYFGVPLLDFKPFIFK